jgi:hypothetical protein
MKKSNAAPILHAITSQPLTCKHCGRIFTTKRQIRWGDDGPICRQRQACEKRTKKLAPPADETPAPPRDITGEYVQMVEDTEWTQRTERGGRWLYELVAAPDYPCYRLPNAFVGTEAEAQDKCNEWNILVACVHTEHDERRYYACAA